MRAQRPDIVQGVTDKAGLLLERLASPRETSQQSTARLAASTCWGGRLVGPSVGSGRGFRLQTLSSRGENSTALAPEALPRPGPRLGRMSDLETCSHKLLRATLPIQAKHRTQRRRER